MASTTDRLYGLSVRWGLATGAVVGGATGALLGFESGIGERVVEMLIGLPMVVAGYGVIVGVVISVIPALTGAAGVVAIVRRSQSDPRDAERVDRDLGVAFLVLVLILNAVFVLLAVAMDIRTWSAVRLLPFVIVANASGLLMLQRARRSIVAAWSRP